MAKLLGTTILIGVVAFFVSKSVVVSQEVSGPCIDTGPRCIDNCSGQPDGNYQWCEGCSFYIACVGGVRYVQPCLNTQVWHDLFKACVAQSTTCIECVIDKPPTSSLPTPTPPPIARDCASTGSVCIETCGGSGTQQDNYQWCGSCKYFLQCIGGVTHHTPCQPGLVYDHNKGWCDYESDTCRCNTLPQGGI